MARVAINGLGRIGRATLKQIIDDPELEIVAVNDLVAVDDLAYLLRHDSVYGRFEGAVEARDGGLAIAGRTIRVTSEEDPAALRWDEAGADLVLECTGVFRTRPDLERHIEAGAERVVLSAPAKDDEVPTIVHGVNTEDGIDEPIVSTASCTTNCIAPVCEIMDRRFGIDKALLTTTHAYTSSQELVDAPSSKRRRGRAAAVNLVPTTTGAAEATALVLPQLRGRFTGIAIRCPVPVGSISDMVFLMERETDEDELERVFREEQAERYAGILATSDEQIVSSDIVRDPHASVVDLTLVQVVDGRLVKVLAWYDNEWGYAAQMIRQARAMLGLGRLAGEPALQR